MNESMNLLAKLSDFCSPSLSPSHLSLPPLPLPVTLPSLSGEAVGWGGWGGVGWGGVGWGGVGWGGWVGG